MSFECEFGKANIWMRRARSSILRLLQVQFHSGTRNETALKRHLTHEPNLTLRQDIDKAVPMDEHKQIIKLRPQ